MRVAREFRIFTNVLNSIVDPKNFDRESFVEFEGDVCIVPPNSFALARSVEYFRIPRDVVTITVGKSTYARCGIITNVTPFEPEWEGYVTLEISNTTPLPAKIYANEGIAQVLFFRGTRRLPCRTRTRRASTRGRRGSPCPNSDPLGGWGVAFVWRPGCMRGMIRTDRNAWVGMSRGARWRGGVIWSRSAPSGRLAGQR